ncbi:aconitase family protein [Anaerobium acetethylicum]|uniref:3-isopropylmalate/(R)-2-methylmalate dehydratase large subunit n=1 Tax=Anaerobium acetethylicum TaxID=1619234 RepID=A0A1D3TVJ6_9FIRM|nr:aconitase family protein [Anaerobium acetethylicum]SCP98144.1 3-isopropylmalate/(R)-2-methylmalate dehydratase large subunit [Anaerobium acetethylicum]
MSTFIERILGKEAGSVATIMADYVVINDGISNAAVDEISAVGNQEKVWVIHDHDVPTGSTEAAGILRKNLEFATRNGCHYVQAQGVGYQYMLNDIIKPGEIIIGGGTHGSIFGAKKALGINVSIPELARIAETGRYSVIVPETVSVTLTGNLQESVSVMDAAMDFLTKASDVKGKVIEFGCPSLDDHQKAVLCSMACMTGAYAAVIVEEQSEQAVVLDLTNVKPMIMMPCASRSEQDQAKIAEKSVLEGTELQAGQIGGYTGGTIEELRTAAGLIKDKKLARGFRLSICPATSKDYIQAMEEGIITKFIDYGAQIQAPGDHSVVTQGAGAMGHNEKLLTTGLYTFAGAMGCEDAEVYTASVNSVIAASYTKLI